MWRAAHAPAFSGNLSVPCVRTKVCPLFQLCRTLVPLLNHLSYCFALCFCHRYFMRCLCCYSQHCLTRSCISCIPAHWSALFSWFPYLLICPALPHVSSLCVSVRMPVALHHMSIIVSMAMSALAEQVPSASQSFHKLGEMIVPIICLPADHAVILQCQELLCSFLDHQQWSARVQSASSAVRAAWLSA